MKIKLLIRRATGSTVEMDGVTYVFNAANDHTCEVDNDEHAQRLLDQEPHVFVESDPAAKTASEVQKPAGGRKKKTVESDPAAKTNSEA